MLLLGLLFIYICRKKRQIILQTNFIQYEAYAQTLLLMTIKRTGTQWNTVQIGFILRISHYCVSCVSHVILRPTHIIFYIKSLTENK